MQTDVECDSMRDEKTGENFQLCSNQRKEQIVSFLLDVVGISSWFSFGILLLMEIENLHSHPETFISAQALAFFISETSLGAGLWLVTINHWIKKTDQNCE